MADRVDWSTLKEKNGFYKLMDDLFMVVVVLLNLCFILFDWQFSFAFFQEFVKDISYDFYVYYSQEVHPNFLLYDFWFVAIFITELLIRWAIAVKDKVYSRWWLYPVANWYDVVGCIPLGVFRWLRVLRIGSMVLRLHRMGVIDLKKTFVFEQIIFLYKRFTNRITDKVLINLVDGIQREVVRESDPKEGSTAISDAVKPDQEQLAEALTKRIQKAAEDNYLQHRETLKEQIETIVRDGFENSKEMKKVEALPVVGRQITETLETTLGDITYELVDSLFTQVISPETGKLMEDSINTTLDAVLSKQEQAKDAEEEELNRIIRKTLARMLDRIKNDIGKEQMFVEDAVEQ